MQKIYVGASWKMNKTVSQSIGYIKKLQAGMEKIFKGPSDITVFVLPTYLALDAFSKTVTHPNLKFGSQNCFWEDEGAYTGEVSPMHLKDLGCGFVELGHPERRRILREDNLMINKKIKACIGNSITPIVCIGEPEKPRKEGQAQGFLKNQLDQLLEGIEAGPAESIILAYEPVWAIGARDSATPEHVREVLSFIRGYLDARYGQNLGRKAAIIYGGAVKATGAKELLAIEENNGIFIGRASLDAGLFLDMVDIARQFEKLKN
ncbi:MAG: triose-phosphate isomerase family protein [Actinomycetota bacterium]